MSIAGLPASSAWVKVGPPLSASGPSSASVSTWSLLMGLQVASLNTLLPSELIATAPAPNGARKQPKLALSATIVFCRLRVALASVNVPRNKPPAVPPGELLSIMVLLVMSTTPSVMKAPPPCHAVAVLPLIVLLTIVALPSDRIPPPTSWAMFPLMVLREPPRTSPE